MGGNLVSRDVQAVDRSQPELVLHDHWHQANRERISDRTEVIGLAEDGRSNHTALLSTQPTLKIFCR